MAKKKSNLIEELDKLGEQIMQHRDNAVARKAQTIVDLGRAVMDFYTEINQRYGSILQKTNKIHNACTQYTLDCGHGKLEIGLADTGLFSTIAGWQAYSFGSYNLVLTGKDKAEPGDITALRDFLAHKDWGAFDKQVAEQFTKYLREYETDTNAMDSY